MTLDDLLEEGITFFFLDNKREIPKPQKHIYLMKCNDESLIFVMLKKNL